MEVLSMTPSKPWELPDVLIFHIVSFIAAPTHRAATICHQLAPLCREAYNHLLLLQDESSSSILWGTILKEDYGTVSEDPRKTHRASKQLRQTTVHRVRNAHMLINENTEIAFFYLTGLVTCSTGFGHRKSKKLSLCEMNRLLDEYGPNLRMNKPMSTGGVFLVEVCRARHVAEKVVLKCVQALVERRGALIALQTEESKTSTQTALCVASVRGMPTVVKYLLIENNANRDICCSGRFARHTNARKTLRCVNKTPLEFAQAMKHAELEAGSCEIALKRLNRCIRLLQTRS
jgi:hypothetical protein